MNTEPSLEVKAAIQNLLQQRMDRFGFDRAEVNAGEDHTGDPALFIDAFYHLTKQPVDTTAILRLLTEIRKLLVQQMGEARFPYIRHHFDEQQAVEGRRQRPK
jgi:hypothetical protein